MPATEALGTVTDVRVVVADVLLQILAGFGKVFDIYGP
jgi:hypothetical protein